LNFELVHFQVGADWRGVAMLKLIALVCVLSLAAPFTGSAAADPATDALARSPRVRAGDSRSALLLTNGLERSDTFRSIVQQLEERDVIVYIEIEPALHRRLAGKMTWVGASSTHRYVRVSLNPELPTDLAISTLGHELRHALEVATAPQVVSARTLEDFYARNGTGTRGQVNSWDTLAARDAGDEVRRELLSPRPSRTFDSIAALNPQDWLVVYRRARSMLAP
jgi:hypothetical protein